MPPALPILVYDGDCAFCSTSARFARSWVDRRGRYAIDPWQDLDLAELGLSEAQCLEAAQFVHASGAVLDGHRAIAAALTHGAPPWRPLGRLLTAPGIDALAARTYGWVARHRHQLPGGTPACAVRAPGPS